MTDLDVTTRAGVVRGRLRGDLRTWRGIPYAAPPVGPLRLRAPQPVAPWQGVRPAVKYGAQAPQAVAGPAKLLPSSEDCLTLNVVAPALPSAAPRPVMVFLHGGGYTIGTSRTAIYRGDALARRGDLVYVSVNYRLGVLGYLDFSPWGTPERPVDSNLGLRDQVAALEWVRDNIAAFGGDPTQVTVFGESAGGSAVTTLMATPAAEGLFAAAIAQSPAPSSVVTQDDAAVAAGRVLEVLGGDTSRLFHAPAAELVAAADRVLMDAVDSAPGTRAAAPVVDGDVLPEHPLDAFEAGRQHRVPLVIGTNDREGALFPRVWDILATTPDRIDGMFERMDPPAKERVAAAYPGYPSTDAAIDLGGDSVFWWPSTLVAQAHAQVAPTWVYRYDYAPPLFKATGFGATHGTELPAVFGYGLGTLGALVGTRALRAVSDRVQAQWLSVARTGAPLPSWPQYGASRTTLVIDRQDRLEDDPRRERRLAWDGYRARR